MMLCGLWGERTTDKVKLLRQFLVIMIEIMPVMFIPAGVGLMESWGELKAVLVPVLVITLVSTIVVMVVSGRVTQAVIRLEKKHKGGDAK